MIRMFYAATRVRASLAKRTPSAHHAYFSGKGNAPEENDERARAIKGMDKSNDKKVEELKEKFERLSGRDRFKEEGNPREH